MFKIQNSVLFLFVVINFSFTIHPISKANNIKSNVIVGANQISKYENLLKDKRIGIIGNHTSVIFKKNSDYIHLVDSLIKLNLILGKFLRLSMALEELSQMELISAMKLILKQA